MIDAVGVIILAACAGIALWLTVFRFEARAVDGRQLREALRTARWDLSTLEQAKARQSALVKQRHEELSKRGHPPESAPVEGYVQALSGWAARRDLSALGQTPLPSRSYPGLNEQLLTYDVSGSLPGIAQFLRDVERADFWADISHLAIEQATDAALQGQCVANLTFSLFAAPAADAVQAAGGGT
ncbi:MAG: hypothetical protein J5J06_04480 [Phycisphaerae bacterium]|nr:hypothetical protein [Phycisphaerae bacterium]